MPLMPTTPRHWFGFRLGWFFLAVAGIAVIVGLQIELIPGLPPMAKLFGRLVGLLCIWKGESVLKRLGR